MTTTHAFDRALRVGAMALALFGEGCLDRPVAQPAANLRAGLRTTVVGATDAVDILFVIDNSGSMTGNQVNLARNLGNLINPLITAPRDPVTGAPGRPPVQSLHVAVVSTDLGNPSGGQICNAGNLHPRGDDGLLNPIRNGDALRRSPPWSTGTASGGGTNGAGARPMECGAVRDPMAYPTFLEFDASVARARPEYQRDFLTSFVCSAFLASGGCGVEQPLEAAYRALVSHDARARAGNTSRNAGFVRDNALLAIVVVTDEEDGSTRDCRYAEPGVPCTTAASAFDPSATGWGDQGDYANVNLRFYNYVPGSAEDPTWNLDRYITRGNPDRGFLSLKPGHPERVIFSAIAGVPQRMPTRADTRGVDWAALLGRSPDGSDGYVAAQDVDGLGPVSMRQRNLDTQGCATTDCAATPGRACPARRMVPACRRRASEAAPGLEVCQADVGQQYYALPSRRIAEVARRFDEEYQNGFISSVCDTDYSGALGAIADRLLRRLSGRCLSRAIETVPAPCEPGDTRAGCVRTNCIVREILPEGVSAQTACTAARGRAVGERDVARRRDTCVVQQVALPPGATPPAGREGFYYDTRPDPTDAACTRHVEFTANAAPTPGAEAVFECVQELARDGGAP